jgi:hypothetical protein
MVQRRNHLTNSVGSSVTANNFDTQSFHVTNSSLGEKRSDDNAQAAALGTAGRSRHPALRPTAKAHRLFAKPDQLGDREIDWNGPTVAIPVVCGFRVQAVSPCLFVRI